MPECAPERSGKILIDDQQKYAGGYIADMSINVDIIQGSSAEATIVNDEGSYGSPNLGVSLGSEVKISIEDDNGETAFATDYFPIESSLSSGPGGKLLKVSFIEAGPSLMRKIPVLMRGRMVSDGASSGGMAIMIGERYYTSANQGGELVKQSNLSDAQQKKLDGADGRTRNNELQARITSLFTGRELYEGIQDNNIPHTSAFQEYLWTTLDGHFFSNGGDLFSVLQEVGRRLGTIIYWNGFVKGGYISIDAASTGGPGPIGLDIFTGAGNINQTIKNAEGKSALIRGTSTTSLRGTSALGNAYSLDVAPDDIANMERGIVTSQNIGGASTKTQITNCAGKPTDVTKDFFRDDGSKEDPTGDVGKKIVDYGRLINAARMGQTFFTVYVYLKLIAQQHELEKGNVSWDSAYAWGGAIPAPILERNKVVEQLYQDCITISSPYKTTDKEVNVSANAKDRFAPWSHWTNIGAITNALLPAATSKLDKEKFMVAYVEKAKAVADSAGAPANLANVDRFSGVYESIMAAFTLIGTEVFLIPGDEAIACGKRTKENTLLLPWEKETKLYAPFSVNKTNPWEIMTEDHSFYLLAKEKAGGKDWVAAEAVLRAKNSKGFNCITLVSFLRGDWKTLLIATTKLSCPDAEKDTNEAKKDGDSNWACDTQHIEMMPDGIVAWGTKENTAGLTQEDSALGEEYSKFYQLGDKQDKATVIQEAQNADYNCLLVPYFKAAKVQKQFDYLWQELISPGVGGKPATYVTKSAKISRDGDKIDSFLDDLENAFEPLDIHSKLITNTPQIAYEKLGPRRNFLSSRIAKGSVPALNVNNSFNSVSLEEVLKGVAEDEGSWSQAIKKITCDGTVRGGSGTTGGIISYSGGLTNKIGVIYDNLNAMALKNVEWNYNTSVGGSYTYAGIPSIPSIWEGLMGLGVQMTAQGGLTTTINLGQIKMQRSNYQQQQQGSLRNFILSAGYDSVNQFFGSKFKNNTQQTLGGASVGITKPNQANTMGDTSVPPPKST